MPADLYNGMTLVLLKNSAPGAGVSGQMAVFGPKPRLIKMELIHEGEDTIRVGPITKTAWRYLVKLEIGGLTGVLASVVGKDPPDLRYWLMAGDVPAFARFQGAMYMNGPVWRIELTRSEEHTSELQSPCNLVCRLLLEKKKKTRAVYFTISRQTSRTSARRVVGAA